MNRKEFDKLTVDEQVIYINKQSQLGISMRGSAKKIGIPHSTLQERFKVKGYSFNVAARQYMKDDDKCHK